MILFPATDIIGGKAVRLLRGDYSKMTVYNDDPLEVAEDFAAKGCCAIHMVDLEGARDGGTPNLETVRRVAQQTDLFVEIGGGIRSMETVETYFSIGVDRVILGTAAVEDEAFLKEAVQTYGRKIAVGADVRDGYVSIKGWRVQSSYTLPDFCRKMQNLGVDTLICTDISKDGAMGGTNREMYRNLLRSYNMKITASGGISSLDDIQALTDMGLSNAIIGKAYYTGDIDLRKAAAIAGPQEASRI